jgi:PAS domain S-box-containing protein
MTDKAHVLLVDDDPEFTRTLSDTLSAEGLTATVAVKGRDALTTVKVDAPVVAVLDLALRDISGLQVLKGIKEQSPDIECIVLTSQASHRSAIEAVNLGAYSYLLKPIDIEQLVLTIRRAIEKTKAQRALRESEEKHRLFVEKAIEGIALLDAQGNILEANARALEIAGLAREQVVGRNAEELLALLALKDHSLMSQFKDRLHGPPQSSVELTLTNPNGREFTLLARTSLVRQDHEITGIRAVVEDVTQRRRSEEELHRLRDFNESIVQNMAEGVAVLDEAGYITFVNPAMVSMWGYEERELMGRHWSEIVPPDQHHIVRAAYKRRLRGDSDSYEVEHMRKNGTRFVTLVSGSPRFENGKLTGTFAVFTDITELKKAQEEVAKLSQFQESIIDNANVWLDVIDGNANVVIWNKAAESVSGYGREEVVGHDRIWEWLYPDEEYRSAIMEKVAAVTKGGDVVEDFETVVRRKDGQSRVVSWHARNLLDEEGKPVGSIALGRDVTEHKQLLKNLQQSEEKYRNLVERANDGIAIIQDSLLKYVNPALTAISGYGEEQLLNTTFHSLIWPDDHATVEEHYRRRLAGEEQSVTYEAGLVHRNGHRVPVELNAGTITYLGQSADLVIVRDIAESKLAEEEIQQRTLERERRLAEMTALYEISLEIVGQLELPRLMQSILKRAVSLLRTEAGGLWICRGDDELQLVADYGVQESLVGARLALGEGLVGKVVRTGRTGAIDDYADWEGRITRFRGDTIRALVSAPLKWGDEMIGVISVYETAKARAWNQDELRLLTLLGNKAAVAVKNARLHEETTRRAKELEALYRVSLDLAGRLELPDLLEAIVRRAMGLLRGDKGGLFLYDEDSDNLQLITATGPDKELVGIRLKLGEGACGRAAQSTDPLIVTDYLAWEGRVLPFDHGVTFNSLNVPIRRGDNLLGVLYIDALGSEREFDQEDVRLASFFANHAAIAIENARLLGALTQHQSDLQRLSAQLITAQEEERRRISQELHDQLGQALTAMSINLAAIEGSLPPAPDPAILERLAETNSLIDETLDQMRDLSLELRPSMLDDLGLLPTLRWYVQSYQKRAGTTVMLEIVNLEQRLAPEMETALYRIVQEALTNAARHAQASTVNIRLECRSGAVVLLIEDNGVGLDTERAAVSDVHRGAGLLGIRERVASQDGTLHIESQPQEGTRLTIEMPLTQEP